MENNLYQIKAPHKQQVNQPPLAATQNSARFSTPSLLEEKLVEVSSILRTIENHRLKTTGTKVAMVAHTMIAT
jgi:hypothetical protein